MKLSLLLGWFCVPLTLPAEVTVQGPPEETRVFLSKNQSQVTLRGKASMVVEATEVKVEVHVSSDASTLGAVVAAHEEQKRNLLAKMQAIGIARGQVSVPKFATINPKFGASGDQAIGYRADSTLTVELPEQKQYVDLLSVLEKTREARLGKLTYNHAQLANLQKQILAAACKRVMTRKEVYEQSLGLTLRPLQFIEDGNADDANNSDQSHYGQITVQSSVQVVFDIQPAPPARAQNAPAAPVEAQ